MRSPLLIYGASGHALVVADIVRAQGEHEVAGFLDDSPVRRAGLVFSGAAVLGGAESLEALRSKGLARAIVAVGDCRIRLRLAEILRSKGFELAIAIHPRSVVAPGVSVGEGTVVCAGAILAPGVSIGENAIVNTAASVDHECVIEDGVHVSPGAHLAGEVTVEKGAWIGIGATIVNRVRVGAFTTVGAGAVVTRDLPEGVVAYGVPARVVRNAERS